MCHCEQKFITLKLNPKTQNKPKRFTLESLQTYASQKRSAMYCGVAPLRGLGKESERKGGREQKHAGGRGRGRENLLKGSIFVRREENNYGNSIR